MSEDLKGYRCWCGVLINPRLFSSRKVTFAVFMRHLEKH